MIYLLQFLIYGYGICGSCVTVGIVQPKCGPFNFAGSCGDPVGAVKLFFNKPDFSTGLGLLGCEWTLM